MALVIIEIEDEENAVDIKIQFSDVLKADEELTTAQALALEIVRHAKEVLKYSDEE